jgi:hypothetical protein
LRTHTIKKIDILFFLIILCCAGKYLLFDNWNSPADDFASIYVAAQLVADGKPSSIYDHHPRLFNVVPPGEFEETSQQIGFKGFLHPYVYLPLVALLFRPFLFIPYFIITKLLLSMNLLALMLSLILIVYLVNGRFNLRWFSFALLAMTFFFPLRYGLRLGQTTPLIFLGLTGVYYLSKADHSKIAGSLLGGIICLKITPVLLLSYFIVKKRWSLVVASVSTIVVVGSASVFLMGGESNVTFIRNILRVCGDSLANWNNQSFDGFLLRCVTDASHLYDWQLLTLPFKVKVLKYTTLSCMFVLWLVVLLPFEDKRGEKRGLIDFSLTLIMATIFLPIAWSHYLLFLVFPYVVLLIAFIRDNTLPYRTLMIAAVVLSYPAIALPPSYFLKLLDFPLVAHAPLSVLSSLGFLGGIVVVSLIVLDTALIRKTHRVTRESSL